MDAGDTSSPARPASAWRAVKDTQTHLCLSWTW